MPLHSTAHLIVLFLGPFPHALDISIGKTDLKGLKDFVHFDLLLFELHTSFEITYSV